MQKFLTTSPYSIALLCLNLVLDYFLILQENTCIALIHKLAQKHSFFKEFDIPPSFNETEKNKYANKVSIYDNICPVNYLVF